MGQYYRAVVFEKDDYSKIDVYRLHFMKLMEHSWIKNPSVNAVIQRIENNPCYVAWVGDYYDAEEVIIECGKKTILYSMVALANSIPYRLLVDANLENYQAPKYIINHTKHEYCELKCCSVVNGWQINPLPLLTACGNGRGGGDYEGSCMDYVGHWAGNIIEASNNIPNGYKEIIPDFVETR